MAAVEAEIVAVIGTGAAAAGMERSAAGMEHPAAGAVVTAVTAVASEVAVGKDLAPAFVQEGMFVDFVEPDSSAFLACSCPDVGADRTSSSE